MTQLDDEEALFLAHARNGLAPTHADEQRVLRNLRAQIALGASVQGTGTLPKSPWPLRIVGSVAVIGAVALSGGLGYLKGWEAGIAKKNQPEPRANPAVIAPPTRGDSPPIDVKNERPLRVEPERSTPSESERVRVSDAKSVASALRARSVPSVPAPSASAALGLDEEVRQLRRVERAIREGNPRFALVLLDELERAIPAGQLLEERGAASIMANCQVGESDAVSNARAFVAKHAGSAYLNRVIEICGLEDERNPAAAGTNSPRSGG